MEEDEGGGAQGIVLRGATYRMGDCVHLVAPQAGAECYVARIAEVRRPRRAHTQGQQIRASSATNALQALLIGTSLIGTGAPRARGRYADTRLEPSTAARHRRVCHSRVTGPRVGTDAFPRGVALVKVCWFFRAADTARSHKSRAPRQCLFASADTDLKLASAVCGKCSVEYAAYLPHPHLHLQRHLNRLHHLLHTTAVTTILPPPLSPRTPSPQSHLPPQPAPTPPPPPLAALLTLQVHCAG